MIKATDKQPLVEAVPPPAAPAAVATASTSLQPTQQRGTSWDISVLPREEQRARNVALKDPTQREGLWRRFAMGPESAAHLAAERASGEPVPSKFGVPGGVPIRNIKSILDDTWRALGSAQRPAIVYVMCKGVDRFAHAAIAYRRPDGELMAMNIVGKTGQHLCNFMPLEEYLFGVDELTRFNEHGIEIKRPSEQGGPYKNPEGGAYHRDIDLVVIWDWPQDKLDAMHEYYKTVNVRQRDRGPNGSRFRLVAGDWRDWYDRMSGKDKRESGNCSVWTSRGLQVAGVVDWFSMWPKETAVRILKGIGRENPDNVDIVSVPWIEHARRTHQSDARLIAKLPFVKKKLDFYPPKTNIMISHTQLVAVGPWKDLATRAGARIVVDPGSTVAHVERQSRAFSRL